VAWSDPPTGTDSKSIQWSGFPSVPGRVKEVRLKFDYNRNGGIAGNGTNSWSVIIGGESAVFQLGITDNVSGSVDYLMSSPVPPQAINVFEGITASVFVGGFSGGATLSSQISNLRLEVTYEQQPHPIIIM
jgi:hypothetical protein